MPTAFPVTVIAPDRILFSGDAEMVACRTLIGEIAFFAGHVPLVGALDVCSVRVVPTEGDEVSFPVRGGFVEVRGNMVTVLASEAGSDGEDETEAGR